MTVLKHYSVELFGGPTLTGPDGPCALSPFQYAFLALIYAEENLSRPRVSKLLWNTEPDARARARIRQLRHQVQKRSGAQVIASAGDLLSASADVQSDVRDFRADISSGIYLPAAERLSRGLLSTLLMEVGEEFEDWRDSFERRLKKDLVLKASTAWEASKAGSEWERARDAAEALHVLNPQSQRACARLVEARARVGKLRAAEIIYAEYRLTHGSGEKSSHLTKLMERARTADREAAGPAGVTEGDFVGRDDEIEYLSGIFEKVTGGSFAFGLLSGDAGIGKSRLLRELKRAATLRGIRCISARSAELERRISLNPILDAVSTQDLATHLDALGDPWRSVVGSMLPPGSTSLPLLDVPPIDDQRLSRRLLDAFALLLKRLAKEQPTVLFLDDLQWADETTLSLLHFYQRRWPDSAFGVVATIRTNAPGDDQRAGHYLTDPKLPSHRVDLGELSRSEGERLIESLGEGSISDVDSQRIVELAGFHPLYLTELSRDHLAGRLVFPDLQPGEVQIPVSVKGILQARTAGLSSEAVQILHFLSVEGRPMRIGDLSRLSKVSVDTVVAGVEELRRHRIVDLDLDTAVVSHDLFRTALYEDLSESKRAVLHREIATHLLQSTEGDHAGALATHLERAGEGAEAALHGWTAGEHAMHQGAIAEAAYFFELVIRNEKDGLRRAQAIANLGDALFFLRDMARAIPALEIAVNRLREVGLFKAACRSDLRRIESLASAGSEPLRDLLDGLSRVKEEATEREDWEAVALALDVELHLLHQPDDQTRITPVFREMRDVASRGVPAATTVCHLGLAMEVLYGDPASGLSSAHLAVRLSEDSSEHRPKALVRLMAALLLRGRLMRPEFERLVTEARLLTSQRGDLRLRFLVESNLAAGLMDAGELDRAETILDDAAGLLGCADMDLDRFNHANNRAELALARSQYDDAIEWFTKAEKLIGSATPAYAQDLVRSGLGFCALEIGSLKLARQMEEAVTSTEGPWTFDPTTILAFRTRLLERRGQVPDAITSLAKASAHLHGRLDLAWLRLGVFRLRKLRKWGYQNPVRMLANDYSEFALKNNLTVLAGELKSITAGLVVFSSSGASLQQPKTAPRAAESPALSLLSR